MRTRLSGFVMKKVLAREFVQATEIHEEKEPNKTTAKIVWAPRKIRLIEGN